MTITIITQLGASDLSNELTEQPRLTACVLDHIGRHHDATELADWAGHVLKACGDDARCAIAALAARLELTERTP